VPARGVDWPGRLCGRNDIAPGHASVFDSPDYLGYRSTWTATDEVAAAIAAPTGRASVALA